MGTWVNPFFIDQNSKQNKIKSFVHWTSTETGEAYKKFEVHNKFVT